MGHGACLDVGGGIFVGVRIFFWEGSDSGGIRAFSVGVRSRVLTSLSSLFLEVVLYRNLTLDTSL